jgi:MFS superfamily sulfate permease-like transporter
MTLLHIQPIAEDMQDAEFHWTPYFVISGFMCGISAIVIIIQFLSSIGWRQLQKYVLDGVLFLTVWEDLLMAVGVGLTIGFFLFVHDMSELWKPTLEGFDSPKVPRKSPSQTI